MKGRTYRYFTGEPLFEFGFGLSYSTFEYSNLTIPFRSIKEISHVWVSVKNSGIVDGDEVAQLYISRKNADEQYPIRTLKGLQKVHLKAGESKVLKFELSFNDFSVLDTNFERIVETGEFEISVGGSQPNHNTTKSIIQYG